MLELVHHPPGLRFRRYLTAHYSLCLSIPRTDLPQRLLDLCDYGSALPVLCFFLFQRNTGVHLVPYRSLEWFLHCWKPSWYDWWDFLFVVRNRRPFFASFNNIARKACEVCWIGICGWHQRVLVICG